MKIGYCMNMLGTPGDPIGIRRFDVVKAAGVEYLELSLRDVVALSADGFERLREYVDKAGIPCLACNNFFPASVRLTGPSVTPPGELAEYVGRALERAAALGARTVVFGSADARNVPGGFERKSAYEQLVQFLREISEECESRGIVVVIEPLNRIESNIVNSVADGLALADAVDRPSIRVLADAYHVGVEKETLPKPAACAGTIAHAHVADVFLRGVPVVNSGITPFTIWLDSLGYRGDISVEAYCPLPDAEATERIGRGLALIRPVERVT